MMEGFGHRHQPQQNLESRCESKSLSPQLPAPNVASIPFESSRPATKIVQAISIQSEFAGSRWFSSQTATATTVDQAVLNQSEFARSGCFQAQQQQQQKHSNERHDSQPVTVDATILSADAEPLRCLFCNCAGPPNNSLTKVCL